MEEQRCVSSSGLVSNSNSNSKILGEKRNGNGFDEKDELGSKRAKLLDPVSDVKVSSNLQSEKNVRIVHKGNNSSDVNIPVKIVGPDGNVVRPGTVVESKVVKSVTRDDESRVVANSGKEASVSGRPGPVVESKANLVSVGNDRLVVGNTGKEVLVKNVKEEKSCESQGKDGVVFKNSSVVKPKEVSESVVSPRGVVEMNVVQRDPLSIVPSSEKVGSEQVCSAAGTTGESDSMRRWREMKKNGFLSGPLGGVTAPSPAVVATPVEVPAPAPKPQKSKKKNEYVKKKNEVPRKEQQQVDRKEQQQVDRKEQQQMDRKEQQHVDRKERQQVDRFANVTAPSGLLTELNPGIINRIRSQKQVCSIIESMIRNATYDASTGGRHVNLNVRESVKEEMALTFKLPSTGVSDNTRSITNPEQATALAVEAATVASQWLEFLHQDLSGRLSAVQDSRNRVQSILTTELPLLASSRDSSSNQATTPQMTNTNTSGDASSDKKVTETHQIRWTAKFDQINKALNEEERDLERSLNQVKEMQSRCNEGLRQMEDFSPFSSQSSDSSFGKDGNQETSMAVQAAAASIFSTCSFLLSMMKPPPTGS